MARGFCPTCEKPVVIVEGLLVTPQPEGMMRPRSSDWYPIPHDHPDGGPCPGHKRAIR